MVAIKHILIFKKKNLPRGPEDASQLQVGHQDSTSLRLIYNALPTSYFYRLLKAFPSKKALDGFSLVGQ